MSLLMMMKRVANVILSIHLPLTDKVFLFKRPFCSMQKDDERKSKNVSSGILRNVVK
jgi:hypothetical protein